MAKWEGTDYSDVDAQALFDAEGILYRTGGKNISVGWIGVCCPFCGEQAYHCGVNLDSKRYSCWVCAQTGTLLKLVCVFLKVPWGEGNKIIDGHRGHYYEAPVRELSEQVVFPDNMGELTANGKKYLRDRGFNPEQIADKYGLKETNVLSKLKLKDQIWQFKCRIIIPIIMNREIVTYTGRDWTTKQDPRYQNAPVEAGTIQTSECIYNIDTVKDRALFLEGPTDVWKMGDETVAMLGVKFSHAQIHRIVKKNLKKAIILFDAKAEDTAKLLHDVLYPFIPDLQVFIMEEDDPGSMDIHQAHKLKYDLLGV